MEYTVAGGVNYFWNRSPFTKLGWLLRAVGWVTTGELKNEIETLAETAVDSFKLKTAKDPIDHTFAEVLFERAEECFICVILDGISNILKQSVAT